jgi:putative transposase
MLGGRLESGMHVMYCGREQLIEKRLSDGQLQLKDVATNQFSAHAEEKLRSGLFAGNLTMLGYAGEYKRLKERQEKTRVGDFTALEDDDQRKIEAHWREAYVLALDAVGQSRLKFTPEVLMPIIKKVGGDLGDIPADEHKKLTKDQQKELKESGKKVQPSPISVYRWYIIWEEAAKDVLALVSATASQGNYERKISQDREKCDTVIAIIADLIDRVYLTLERPSVQDIWDEMEGRIRRENEYREGSDQLPIPHINTLYGIINKIDIYERDLARYGKRYADAKHRTNRLGARPTRPLERIEIDETQLPFMVIDPERLLPIGRPWLIWAIDVFTRLIIGFYISFIRPSYAEFMQCLLHAIKPKDYVREKYPSVKNVWLPCGLGECLFTDNAKIYYCGGFKDALSHLGSRVEYSRRFMASDKPYVERSFWTYARRVLRKYPGTTFSNIFEKADYDPKKHALISKDVLEEITHIWVIDIYSRSYHRGLKDVPARVWETSIEKFPPALPYDVKELEVMIGYVAWRKVRAAIEIFGLLYSCDALAVVRQQLKDGEKAKIKFNPEDLSLIWVLDPHNKVYIPVPALDQDYTRGLSLWAHNVIKEYAKRIAKGYVNRDDLCRARDTINLVVTEGIERMKSIGLKSAHWLAQEQHRVSFETGTNATAGSTHENIQMGDQDAMLNAGNHPEAGISDFGGGEPANGESAEKEHKEHATESFVIETSLSKNGTKNKSDRRREKATAKKQNDPKGDSQYEINDAVDNDEDEFEPVDAKLETVLDKRGWSADYDLPV